MRMERLGPFLLRQPPGSFRWERTPGGWPRLCQARRAEGVCDLGTGSGCLLCCCPAGPPTGVVRCGSGPAAAQRPGQLAENGLEGTVLTGRTA